MWAMCRPSRAGDRDQIVGSPFTNPNQAGPGPTVLVSNSHVEMVNSKNVGPGPVSFDRGVALAMLVHSGDIGDRSFPVHGKTCRLNELSKEVPNYRSE